VVHFIIGNLTRRSSKQSTRQAKTPSRYLEYSRQGFNKYFQPGEAKLPRSSFAFYRFRELKFLSNVCDYFEFSLIRPHISIANKTPKSNAEQSFLLQIGSPQEIGFKTKAIL
jgi:hypothetical protein